MLLKLNDIIDIPGGVIPFDYTTDLRDLEINFIYPFKNPVRICGEAANRAGVVTLIADCEADIEYDCMRCAEPVKREWTFSADVTLTESLENPDDIDNADIVVIENCEVDATIVIREQIILDSDMVFTCAHCEN